MDINAKSPSDSATALHRAAYRGHLGVLQYLIGMHANINATDLYGRTPLMMAVRNHRAEVVQYLISQGAQIGLRSTRCEGKIPAGSTALIEAELRGFSDIASILVLAEQRQNQGGFTTTVTPSENLPVAVTQITTVDTEHLPTAQTTTTGEQEALRAELAEDRQTCAAIQEQMNQMREMMQRLLGQQSDGPAASIRPSTPTKNELHTVFQAIRHGDCEQVIALVDRNIPVDAAEQNGKTLLQLAVECEHRQLVVDLIERGAALNLMVTQGDEQGCTALHYAARIRNNQIAEALLIAGASARIPDVNGITPLHWAVSNNNVELVTLLLRPEYGAQPDAPDARGETPLSLAQQREDHDLIALLEAAMPTERQQERRMECPICMEVYSEERYQVAARSCGHVVCIECSQRMHRCPQDRRIVGPGDWQRLFFNQAE